MDEASIINALQEALKDYRVKTQIRRKESQLHVLVTREESDEFDYTSLYRIVKRRIDELAISGASELVVYGRLAGEKHPEWQKSAEIKPPLPLIELDLDELEDLSKEMGDQAISITEDETLLQNSNLDNSNTDLNTEYSSFKASLEDDLRAANNPPSPMKDELFDFANLEELRIAANNTLNNGLGDLDDLGGLEDIGNLNNLDMPEVDLSIPDFRNFPVVTIDSVDLQVPETANNLKSDDFSIDATTVASLKPLPLPPTVHRKPATKIKPQPQPAKIADPNQINKVSIAVGAFMFGVLALCGWLVWDRSVQQKYLADARDLENLNLDPQNIQNLSQLADTRNRIQGVLSQLDLISNRPLSLYKEAQTEIKNLKPKLEVFDRRVSVEYAANSSLELAKKNTLDAALMVQNPPHTSKVWKSALEKRQEAIIALSSVPPESTLYAQAQARLKTYSAELVQIGKWVDIQLRAESVASTVSPAIAAQIQEFKSDPAGKENFLKRCSTILQPEISSTTSQRLGMTLNNLTSYLCAYYWDL